MAEEEKKEEAKEETKEEKKEETREEKKQETKEEKKEETTPEKNAEHVEKPAEGQAQDAQPAGETAKGPAKKKKIARMDINEIEKALKHVKEKMGGMGSHYAQQLLKRKDALKQQ
ncbi:MAG: hypothetical protein ABIH47_03230 [Candidatus Omnitrophota bacterium]